MTSQYTLYKLLDAVAADTTGTAQETAQNLWHNVHVVSTGTIAGTVTVSGTLDNTNYATISAVDIASATTTAMEMPYPARYLKIKAVLSGTSGTGTITVNYIGG